MKGAGAVCAGLPPAPEAAGANILGVRLRLGDLSIFPSERPSCEFRSNPATDSDFIPATIPI
jgi:hypothetical protein